MMIAPADVATRGAVLSLTLHPGGGTITMHLTLQEATTADIQARAAAAERALLAELSERIEGLQEIMTCRRAAALPDSRGAESHFQATVDAAVRAAEFVCRLATSDNAAAVEAARQTICGLADLADAAMRDQLAAEMLALKIGSPAWVGTAARRLVADLIDGGSADFCGSAPPPGAQNAPEAQQAAPPSMLETNLNGEVPK
jgi:hypothetical protein